jgi:alpha-L-fucosidase
MVGPYNLISIDNDTRNSGYGDSTMKEYLDPLKEESPLYAANEGRRDERLFQGWYDRTTEVVDKYRPDIVWVDTSFGGTVGFELQGRSIAGRLLPGMAKELPALPESWQQKFVAHFFNAAAEEGREVEFVYKSFDIPPPTRSNDDMDQGQQSQGDRWRSEPCHIRWP